MGCGLVCDWPPVGVETASRDTAREAHGEVRVDGLRAGLPDPSGATSFAFGWAIATRTSVGCGGAADASIPKGGTWMACLAVRQLATSAAAAAAEVAVQSGRALHPAGGGSLRQVQQHSAPRRPGPVHPEAFRRLRDRQSAASGCPGLLASRLMRRWSSRLLVLREASFAGLLADPGSTARPAPGAIRSTLVGFDPRRPPRPRCVAGESPEPIANTVHRTPTATAPRWRRWSPPTRAATSAR